MKRISRSLLALAASAALTACNTLAPIRLTDVLNLRTRTAEGEIPYSASSFTIKYKSNVDLQAADGGIHCNYDGWALNLTRSINAQLAAS